MIDDQNTDWSKYFRGRRLYGDYEIRVEQAEFRELSLTANEQGTIVSMSVFRNGTKVIRYVIIIRLTYINQRYVLWYNYTHILHKNFRETF